MTRSRGNRGKISFSVDWTTGETRAVSYTIDQQRDKETWGDRGDSFSSIVRRRVFLHTFRGIGAFRFVVKVPIRAAAPTRIPGYRNVLNDAWSNHSLLSHRMFGANTCVSTERGHREGTRIWRLGEGHAQRRGNTSDPIMLTSVGFLIYHPAQRLSIILHVHHPTWIFTASRRTSVLCPRCIEG